MGIKFDDDFELPYVFDLFYDIKTKDQLYKEYKILKRKVLDLENFAKDYNIKLPTVVLDD